MTDKQDAYIWQLEDQIQQLQERLCEVDRIHSKLSHSKWLHSVWVGKHYSLANALADLGKCLEKPTLPDDHDSKASKSMQKRVNIQKGKPMMDGLEGEGQ